MGGGALGKEQSHTFWKWGRGGEALAGVARNRTGNASGEGGAAAGGAGQGPDEEGEEKKGSRK